MSSKINLQTCEYACKSSIFQDNQLILYKEYNSKGYLLLYQIYSDGDVLNDYYSYNFEYDEGNIIKEIWFINNNFYQEIERTFY